MFWNFHLVKNHKIANNSATTKAREKISTDLESFELKKFFDACLTKIKNNQILLNKLAKYFYWQPRYFLTGWKIAIDQIISSLFMLSLWQWMLQNKGKTKKSLKSTFHSAIIVDCGEGLALAVQIQGGPDCIPDRGRSDGAGSFD